MKTKEEGRAKGQARACYEYISSSLDKYKNAIDDEQEEIRILIVESIYALQVRSFWHMPHENPKGQGGSLRYFLPEEGQR